MSIVTVYPTPFTPSSSTTLIRSLAFSTNGDQIAVGYETGLIEIYRTLFVIIQIFYLKHNLLLI
jgi:hypothetical protein